VGGPGARGVLLANGFAFAGSSYAHTGWAIQEGLLDQIAVLDAFAALVDTPSRTIAWGHSLGGIIAAGLIQRFPNRFDAALPMCTVLSGGVGTWNQGLDVGFAFKTLLAFGSPLQEVNIIDPINNLGLAESILASAQATPQGRARLVLASVLGMLPGGSIRPLPSRLRTISPRKRRTSSYERRGWIFHFSSRASRTRIPRRRKPLVGVTVVLGFWVVLIVAVVWGDQKGHHLIGLLPLVAATAILGAFLIALGRNVR